MAASASSASPAKDTSTTTALHQQQRHDPEETASSPGRSAKRQKVTRACDNCKSRKRRCTGEVPCSKCVATGAECVYLAPYTRGRLVQPAPSSAYINVATPSPVLLQPQPQSQARPQSQPHTQPHTQRRFEPEPEPEPARFEPPLQLSYGGEVTARTSRAASPEGGSTFAGQYLGPQSPYSFLRRAWRRFEQDGTSPGAGAVSIAAEEPSQYESIFAYGDRPAPRVNVSSFRLPARTTTYMLLSQYFEFAMPTYRFLHRQTVAQWLESFHQHEEGHPTPVSPGQQAVVLMVLATARLFNVDAEKEYHGPDEQSWEDSKLYYQAAHLKLQQETGRPRLESIQARLATCLYLLYSSRPNYAWYTFGSTVQLIFALGLHRASAAGQHHSHDPIIRECRKRAFWAASTLDTYLSVILGKPPLIHLEDVDQKLPDPVDDEDLTASGIAMERPPRGDSIIKASICHVQITQIVKKAAREQYTVDRKRSSEKLEIAAKLNAETAAWHASLPVVLSGAIHSSSLIPIFRRQITVLQLAHAHARMLINRPSLLLDSGQIQVRDDQVEDCLRAARSTLDTLLATGFRRNIFQAFWYTQYVVFNALSIVYVWLIQRKHGRLPPLKQSLQEDELFQLARAVQKHLSDASEGNAPSLRYSIVLDELQTEVQRVMAYPQQRLLQLSAEQSIDDQGIGSIDNSDVKRVLESVEAGATDSLMDAFGNDFPLDPDLWLFLDSFPFSDLGQL